VGWGRSIDCANTYGCEPVTAIRVHAGRGVSVHTKFP
jgi:hypothetical protein